MTRIEETLKAADEYIHKRVYEEDMGYTGEVFPVFIGGAEWADKTMLDKVCEWLKSYRQETHDGMGYIAGIVNDKTIEDLRKAMEE